MTVKNCIRPLLAAAFLLLPPLFPAATAAGAPPLAGPVNPPGVAWCEDYRPAKLSDADRLRGTNLARLRAAQSELAPGFTPGNATTGLRLLADYQGELGKARPSATLAASYLAQVSTVPITAARYLRLNALLCVSATRALAKTIEADAEAQRLRMAR